MLPPIVIATMVETLYVLTALAIALDILWSFVMDQLN
jgi:hypothetical protein